jgi:cell division transport system permease protein
LRGNLSSYVKENLVVQVMLEQDMTNPEGLQMCKHLKARPYVKGLTYITQAIKHEKWPTSRPALS